MVWGIWKDYVLEISHLYMLITRESFELKLFSYEMQPYGGKESHIS